MEMMKRMLDRVLEVWRTSKGIQFKLETNPIRNSRL
jgi:hypothetical protein